MPDRGTIVWNSAVLFAGLWSLSKINLADDAANPAAMTHVILIGGFDSDPTPQQIAGTARRGEGNSGLYQLRNDLRAAKVSAEYFNWNGSSPGNLLSKEPPGAAVIAAHIREQMQKDPQAKIGIVGNSWGGHTAWEVCQMLNESDPELRIPLVIFLDPSSAGRPDSQRPATLSANVVAAVQYASRSAIVWPAWEEEPRVTAIDLADKTQGFLRPGGPPYAALFSPDAHIGAEWDELIHRDIRRRLQGKPKPKSP